MPALVFCQCGSDRVSISQWNVNRAQFQCLTCQRVAWVDGFTLSDFEPAKLLTDAVVDQARKYRKRPPDELRKLQEQRVARSRRG